MLQMLQILPEMSLLGRKAKFDGFNSFAKLVQNFSRLSRFFPTAGVAIHLFTSISDGNSNTEFCRLLSTCCGRSASSGFILVKFSRLFVGIPKRTMALLKQLENLYGKYGNMNGNAAI